jgi:hypothetical protein
MPIQVRYATESLAPTLASINIDSFAGQGFITNAFSNVADDAIFELKRKRYLQKLAHPKTHVLAAIDEDSGEIVGCARWIFPGEEVGSQLSSEEAAAEAGAELALPEGTNRGIYDGFFEVLKEKGEKYSRADDIGEYISAVFCFCFFPPFSFLFLLFRRVTPAQFSNSSQPAQTNKVAASERPSSAGEWITPTSSNGGSTSKRRHRDFRCTQRWGGRRWRRRRSTTRDGEARGSKC